LRHAPGRSRVLPAARSTLRNRSEAWNISDGAADDPEDPAHPLATLVSFHYLRAAVRRRRRVFVLFALVGVLLAVGYLATNPTLHTASTTLRLSHPDDADPTGAIATDISLVNTRTVASRTIKALGLPMSPESMMESVKAVPTGSNEILQLTMSAPTSAEAVRRLDVFSKEYLNFRAAQISAHSNVLIKGYQSQIDELQSQSDKLREQIDSLANPGSASADQLTQAVTKLSQTNDSISSLQSTVDDATLQQTAVVSASGVIDPAAPTSGGELRRLVLVLASGLIGGLAIGFIVVVLWSILSDRLWLRMEVAAALDAPVLLSVRRIAPLRRPLLIVRWLPGVRSLHVRRAVERQRIGHAIARAVNEVGPGQRVALVCLNNSDTMRFGVVAAAVELQNHGFAGTIVDLTEAGKVASAVARNVEPTIHEPAVLRPRVVPSLADGPAPAGSAGWDDVALASGMEAVALILADFDPAIGVDHLTAWTDSVILAVTAGKSSVELVRTAGDLVRSARLQLRGAVLLRAARNDVSSGIAVPLEEGASAMPDTAVPRPDAGVRPSS